MIPAFDPSLCMGPVGWTPTPIAWLMLALAGGMLALAMLLARLRAFPGRSWLWGVQASAVLWLLSAALATSTSDADCRSTLQMMQRPGMMGVPAFWLAFLAQYAASNVGRLPRWCLWSTLVPWLLLSLGAWTNSAHGMFFAERSIPDGRLMQPGPMFMLARVWVYLLLLASVVLLFRRVATVPASERWHWWCFLTACTLPWLVAMGHHGWGWTLGGEDPTPLGLMAFLLALGALLWRSRAFDLAPHARNLLFDALVDPLLVVGADRQILELNRSAMALGVAQGQSSSQLKTWIPWGRLLDQHWPSGSQAAMIALSDGPTHFEVQVRPILAAHTTIGHLVQLHDVSELVRHRETVSELLKRKEADLADARAQKAELMQQSLQDPLTGLLNRRALSLRFAEEAARCRRTGQPFAMAMIDIDKFKQVNDTYGHPAGDEVLKQLAEHLRHGVRSCDAVFRFGGEEFVVVLSRADLEQAHHRIDQLREAFGACRTCAGGREAVTFSAGVTQLQSQDQSLDDALRRADAALYRAKAGGRNQVQVAKAPL